MNEQLLQELDQRWQSAHDRGVAAGQWSSRCGAHAGQFPAHVGAVQNIRVQQHRGGTRIATGAVKHASVLLFWCIRKQLRNSLLVLVWKMCASLVCELQLQQLLVFLCVVFEVLDMILRGVAGRICCMDVNVILQCCIAVIICQRPCARFATSLFPARQQA